MKHGEPVDDKHSGRVNLTPLQQDRFKDLLKKDKSADSSLKPDDEKELKQLKT